MKDRIISKEVEKRHKCGRNADLVRLRNINLIKRYYYWSEIKRRRIDDILNILSSQEFYISQQTIWRIVKQNHAMITALRNGEEIDDMKVKDENQMKLFE